MSMQDVIDFFRANRGSRFALTAHMRPDGDAIGSAVGLAAILRRAGFSAEPVNFFPIPERFVFLVEGWPSSGRVAPGWADGFDCLVMLDCGEWSRLDQTAREAEGRLKVACIDHHASSQGAGEAVWLEPDASSTGELVARLALAAGWEMPPDAAQALWAAIITDTGCFCYENTGVATLDAARECLIRGANPALASRRLHQSTWGERLLQARVLDRLQFFEAGRLAVTWLSERDFHDAGAGAEGVQDLVNLVRDTAGVDVAIFLYEMPKPTPDSPFSTKVSIRTVAPYDAIELAGRHNGGGHHRAAGCAVPLSLDDAKALITADAQDAYFAKRS